jgi:hypothetical protein
MRSHRGLYDAKAKKVRDFFARCHEEICATTYPGLKALFGRDGQERQRLVEEAKTEKADQPFRSPDVDPGDQRRDDLLQAKSQLIPHFLIRVREPFSDATIDCIVQGFVDFFRRFARLVCHEREQGDLWDCRPFLVYFVRRNAVFFPTSPWTPMRNDCLIVP